MDINANTVTVIGASWCPDCRRAKTFLAEQRIAYDWVDLELHPDATEIVERYNNGSRAIPTIIFPTAHTSLNRETTSWRRSSGSAARPCATPTTSSSLVGTDGAHRRDLRRARKRECPHH